MDETLTADTSGISDDDGLTDVSYSYRWIAGGSDIAGATGSTYTLTDDDAGKSIKVRVSFTDDADHEETLTSAATVVGLPLTVRLVFPVASHHGASNVFTFDIRFSEEIPLSYKTLKFHAFDVTGGTILRAQRMNKPSNIKWRIMVRPDSSEDVTIVLPATTDCDADGAVCTEDGRKLSNSLVFTVSGSSPVAIEVSGPEGSDRAGGLRLSYRGNKKSPHMRMAGGEASGLSRSGYVPVAAPDFCLCRQE